MLKNPAPLEGADPENLRVTEPICTPPAESAEKVISARSSTALFALPDVVPSGLPETVSFDLNTVTAFAFGEDKVTAEEALDVDPSATTTSAAASNVESAPIVAILKVCDVLSVAPDEEYEEISPFRVSETEPARGTITGEPKLNL